jgi:hypothetical protein
LRTLLLLLLTPVRSTNLLCQLLPEQRAWRRFAFLPNRARLPNVRQLHEFRDRLTPRVLRELNAGLLRPLLAAWPEEQPGIALIDATDLPAACADVKKNRSRPAAPRSAGAPSKAGNRGGSSATRSTRCECGSPTTAQPCSSCR